MHTALQTDSIIERVREEREGLSSLHMAQAESNPAVQFVDDLYFSALSHGDDGGGDNNQEEIQIFPISDSKYAEELQFQEALMNSLITTPQPQSPTETHLIPSVPSSLDDSAPTIREIGESSSSTHNCFCEICAEKKETDDMFIINTCSHSFCSDCVTKHVTIKIQESSTAAVVACPGWDCRGVVEFNDFGPLMPAELAARWDQALCEAAIPPSERFYCPFKDCSALLVKDGTGEEVSASECPFCHRLFCAGCYVAWHAGIGCEEFARLGEDERGREDLMVREMARSNSWMRCPQCKFYVDKTDGCLHMTCRCGFQFCYACGDTWSQYHGGCRP